MDSKSCHVIKLRNDLRINRIDYLKDTKRGRLIIYLESNLLLDRDVNAFIQGINLIIEATRSVEYEKPIRMHLIGKETLSECEKGEFEIGFSEVHLEPGFRYTVLSCEVISSGLLKVILSIQHIKNNLKKNVN